MALLVLLRWLAALLPVERSLTDTEHTYTRSSSPRSPRRGGHLWTMGAPGSRPRTAFASAATRPADRTGCAGRRALRSPRGEQRRSGGGPRRRRGRRACVAQAARRADP